MKYAPLPWVHLADELRPSIRKLRIILEEPAFSGERTFVRLYDGPRSEQITDTHGILRDKSPLSARERAALEILHEAGPSHAKKGRFALTKAQMGRLLAFATDVALEVEEKGGIAVVGSPARITGRVTDTEEDGLALAFEATDGDDHTIDEPKVLGDREAYLLDKQQKLYRLTPPLLPDEARSLLGSEALLLDGLATEEGEAGFAAVVGLGCDLADLVEVAQGSDPAPTIVLRAMLTSTDSGSGIALRVHLVTELHHGGFSDEAEVTSRGAIPPVHAVRNGTEDDAGATLVARPTTQEAEARQALFDLGLKAASNHRGFAAYGETALDILVRLAAKEGIPDFVQVDPDALPRIVRLPNVPLLNIRHAPQESQGLLSVHLDIGDEARELALRYDDIVRSVVAGRQSLLLDEDTVLGFTPEAGKALEFISEALELKSADENRVIGSAELALLLSGIPGQVQLECEDEELRRRIDEFFMDPSPDDRKSRAPFWPSCGPIRPMAWHGCHTSIAWGLDAFSRTTWVLVKRSWQCRCSPRPRRWGAANQISWSLPPASSMCGSMRPNAIARRSVC